ncbi:unnamed protein product [Aphanomyces euteiches]|uniref:FYVE-type domain-containing protein n=1 Tax=Aphanomyces euteiches TaxID=100861 RepID=A0A6G0WQY8_9STRA|nr:hypothetical protein Ae201684_012616 [Aphanomyces euteiches]KAH9101025.1 hypothetical protein Ae201684P_007214 [Aphanomyces euteiches]
MLSANKAKKSPLPSGFFQCPPLSPDDVQQLKADAIQSAMEVVMKSQLDNPRIKWTLRSDEVDLTIYRADDPSPGTYLYLSQMDVVGTLDEVGQLFLAQTTQQAKAVALRFGKEIFDAATLYSLVKPTLQDPLEFVGVTWKAYKSPLPFVAKRDACLIECCHSFLLDGRRGWVICTKSVEIDGCPEIENFGFTRMMNYGSGHVFLESDRPNHLEMRYVAHLNFRGVSYDEFSDGMLKRRDIVGDIAMTKRCRNLTAIDQFLREDRLARGHVLRPEEVVPQDLRPRCFLCDVRFGWTRQKSNCLKCGQVVCSSCNRVWRLVVNGRQVRLRACARCALSPAKSNASQMSTVLSDASSE